MLKQGEIIAAILPFNIEHYGVATEFGTVVSASMRTGIVLEEDIEVFSGGYLIVSKGYPSNLNPSEVLYKARTAIGQKWDFFINNCQHFATSCHGQKNSPQLTAAISLGVIFGLIIVVWNLAKK